MSDILRTTFLGRAEIKRGMPRRANDDMKFDGQWVGYGDRRKTRVEEAEEGVGEDGGSRFLFEMDLERFKGQTSTLRDRGRRSLCLQGVRRAWPTIATQLNVASTGCYAIGRPYPQERAAFEGWRKSKRGEQFQSEWNEMDVNGNKRPRLSETLTCKLTTCSRG